MVRFFTWVLGFLLAIILLAGAVGAWFFWSFQAEGPLARDTVVIVRRGGVSEIARQLADAGVIRNALAFTLGAQLEGRAGTLKSGEYAFPARISANGVVDSLSAGRSVRRKLTVPEGLTSAAVLALVSGAEGMDGDVGARPAEGSLLPDTYLYSWGDRRPDLVQRMTHAMSRTVADAWSERAPNLPLKTPEEAVILASIVEKETGRAEERPHIARVFLNRLEAGMRLQSDPTVIFGLTHGDHPLDRPLAHADLDNPSPYNTYEARGLPPGPIANPGRAALRAVMQPMDSQDLYFVADGTGGHAFAQTLPDHNRNVARLRQLRLGPTDAAPAAADSGTVAPAEPVPAMPPAEPPAALPLPAPANQPSRRPAVRVH